MPPPYHMEDWQAAAADARERLFNSIPKEWLLPEPLRKRASRQELCPNDPEVVNCGILTPLERGITEIRDAATLWQCLVDQKYNAVQVTRAFGKRAAIAQQCTACLTEFPIKEALARAKELDRYLEEHDGEPVGVLHGLPISVKDTYSVKGYASTNGIVSWLPNVATENCLAVDCILEHGGIIIAKTSTSQACLLVESINNIYGTVGNPNNPKLSAGGSSGGEAALVRAGGSILGSGADGGGSIRFPAAFCGVWGLKGSKGRFPGKGMASAYNGNESVNAGFGPFACSVAGLEMWVKAQLLSKPWERDHTCTPLPWNEELAKRPTDRLNIAVVRDDGVIYPSRPVSRALVTVVAALRSAGHTVVYLPPETIFPLHRQGLSSTMKCNVQEGGRSIMPHLEASGEPVVPRTAVGHPGSELTAAQIFANHALRGRLAAQYNDLWQTYKMDAILAPVAAHPPAPHGRYISNSYSTIYNMLDYATGNIPVATFNADIDMPDELWLSRKPYERIEPELFPYDLGDKEHQELYTSAEEFKNAPVGVQIACRRFQEEKVISILKEIEALLKNEREVCLELHG